MWVILKSPPVLTNLPNIVRKRDFFRGCHFDAKYMGLCHVKQQTNIPTPYKYTVGDRFAIYYCFNLCSFSLQHWVWTEEREGKERWGTGNWTPPLFKPKLRLCSLILVASCASLHSYSDGRDDVLMQKLQWVWKFTHRKRSSLNMSKRPTGKRTVFGSKT